MGTRHLILVYYKGRYFIAQYGQWDGYPDGQGVVVLKFARDPSNLAKLQAALDNDMTYTPTKDQLGKINREIEKYHDDKQRKARELLEKGDAKGYMKAMDTQDQSENPYPTLSRDAGAKILKFVAEAKEPVPIIREVEFIADTLFCEWAYVVDLDIRVLEVYCGRAGGAGERFENIGGPGYIAKFALDNLPNEKDFLRECLETGDSDEEEPEEEEDVAPDAQGTENEKKADVVAAD